MPTPSGFPTSEDLQNAQKDVEHLGRVVNSEDAQGNPIASSTNRTGGTNKTLDALQSEYQSAIQAAGGVPLGTWASGVTINAYNEYLVYNGIPYKPAASTTPPYTTQGADPTVAPDAGNVVPFAEVQASDLVTVREDLLGPGTQLYMGSNGESVQVGETVPAGTTHLRYNDTIYQMSPTRSGSFDSESNGVAVIGGNECRLVSVSTPISDSVTEWGASEFDAGDNNSDAFDACLTALGSVSIPDGVTLRVKRPIKIGDFDKIKFGADSFVEPGVVGMEVVKFQGDYATGHNVRVINSGDFSDCVGIGFTPRATLEQVGQRYNQIFNIYINGLDKAVVFQCGDFVTAAGFASGCWYNRIYGGEIRNGRIGIEFAPGLNTAPGSATQPPATSNRNSIYDVSQHFMSGAGFNILSGADNWFYNCYYESSNNPLSLGFYVAEQSPEPVVNPNEHNRFIGCGTESVTQSVQFENRFTEVLMWVGEKNSNDDWGDCLYISGNDPSRNPLATPSSYLQNDSFDPDFVVGREYRYLGKGIEYNGGRRDAPTEVGTEFEVYDRNHNWQEVSIPAKLTGATLNKGIMKYKKSGNWVDVAFRMRLGPVSGNLELELPVSCDSEMYVSSVNGPQFPFSGTLSPDGAIENGYAFFVVGNKLRFGTPNGGWGSSLNDVVFSIRYRSAY